MKTKIAPTLRDHVERGGQLHPLDGSIQAARAELRALLAVARAAEVWDDGPCWNDAGNGSPPRCRCEQCTLTTALARLRRASGER